MIHRVNIQTAVEKAILESLKRLLYLELWQLKTQIFFYYLTIRQGVYGFFDSKVNEACRAELTISLLIKKRERIADELYFGREIQWHTATYFDSILSFDKKTNS